MDECLFRGGTRAAYLSMSSGRPCLSYLSAMYHLTSLTSSMRTKAGRVSSRRGLLSASVGAGSRPSESEPASSAISSWSSICSGVVELEVQFNPNESLRRDGPATGWSSAGNEREYPGSSTELSTLRILSELNSMSR